MTSDERLALVRLKIERAKEHIGDLDVAVRAFWESRPYEVSTKRDDQTRKLIYYASKVERTPDRLATITGDIIQNLRSALDHLAYQLFLVGTNGKVSGRHVYFPIFADSKEYMAESPRKIKGMRQSAIDALALSQPYKGGNGDNLWVLNELNVTDKHRLLIAVASSHQSVNVGALGMAMLEKLIGHSLPPLDAFLKVGDTLTPLKVGDELFIDGPDAEVNQKMTFRFNIALNEPGICDGKALLETVQHLHDAVSDLVMRFRPFLA